MPLSLSKKSSLIAQSEIRAMTLECARIGGINLAQGVFDTEVLLPGLFSRSQFVWLCFANEEFVI